MNAKALLFAAAATIAISQAAQAQQQLSVQINSNYGAGQLSADGFGCFDPISAMRLDQEGLAGAPGGATIQAFEVGTCVVLPAGLYFSSVQEVVISEKNLVRINLSGAELRLYSPTWAAAFNGGNYQSAVVGNLGELKDIDAALKTRVGALRKCKKEGDALNARIEEYNARAAEYHDEKEPQTGSRLTRDSASPITRIYLPKAEHARLYEEGQDLSADVAEFEARCGQFNAGFALDRDYMTFYNAL